MTKTEKQPIPEYGEKDTDTNLKHPISYETADENVRFILSELDCKEGEKYFNGIEVKQDYRTALMFFLNAAKAGNKKAQYKLGVFYELGIIVELDEDKAAHWYKKAAESGDEEAQSALKRLGRRYYRIGLKYFDGDSVEQNLQTAMTWFLKAAELGDEEARDIINTQMIKQTL